jgi:large subunit ribosomal protein L15
MSILNKLAKITARPAKRRGRGYGSGKGSHTAGRGNKGMRARKSGEAPLWFEGGQLPLVKRLPMLRGKHRFQSLHPTAEVTLDDLNKMSAIEVTLDTLKLEKIIDTRFKRAKIISNGTLNRKVSIKGLPVSANAVKMIEKAGGSVEATQD